jgi:hypothetical protein
VNPWTVIGWLLLGAFALGVVGAISIFMLGWLAIVLPYYRDRKVMPKPGDVWMQGATRLYIKRITDTGRIVIETRSVVARSGWSDSLEEWEQRRRGRRLYLASRRRLEAA